MYNNILELDSIYENIYESYINDYIIFEGVLRRDYMECIGVLNEDGNKNFLKSIWEKVLKAFKWLRDKIKQLIDKIFKRNKEDSSSEDNNEEETVTVEGKRMTAKEMLKKFESYSSEEKKKLKELKVSGFRFKFNYSHEYNEILKMLNEYHNMIGENTVTRVLDRNLQDKELLDDYNKINNTDVGEKLKEFKQSLYNAMFEKNDIEYPFEKTESVVNNMVLGVTHNYHNKLLNSYIKDIDRSIKNIEYYINHIDERKDKIGDVSQQQKNASLMLAAVNKSSKMITGGYGIIIKCDKLARKQNIKILAAAINYLESDQSTNEAYIDALSEATIYELD